MMLELLEMAVPPQASARERNKPEGEPAGPPRIPSTRAVAIVENGDGLRLFDGKVVEVERRATARVGGGEHTGLLFSGRRALECGLRRAWSGKRQKDACDESGR